MSQNWDSEEKHVINPPLLHIACYVFSTDFFFLIKFYILFYFYHNLGQKQIYQLPCWQVAHFNYELECYLVSRMYLPSWIWFPSQIRHDTSSTAPRWAMCLAWATANWHKPRRLPGRLDPMLLPLKPTLRAHCSVAGTGALHTNLLHLRNSAEF